MALMVSDTAKTNQLARYESKGCLGKAHRKFPMTRPILWPRMLLATLCLPVPKKELLTILNNVCLNKHTLEDFLTNIYSLV